MCYQIHDKSIFGAKLKTQNPSEFHRFRLYWILTRTDADQSLEPCVGTTTSPKHATSDSWFIRSAFNVFNVSAVWVVKAEIFLGSQGRTADTLVSETAPGPLVLPVNLCFTILSFYHFWSKKSAARHRQYWHTYICWVFNTTKPSKRCVSQVSQ